MLQHTTLLLQSKWNQNCISVRMLRPVIFLWTISVKDMSFMNATKSAISAGLRSNFYMLVSQKYGPSQNTRTQNTQQPKWDTATLPLSGFAIFFHGNICHGPKSWHRWSLWAHTRNAALGALSLLFVPLFGSPKGDTSKIRERDVTSALGGHLLIRQHNNQLS